MGEPRLGFTSQNLADEKWEGPAMREHGPMQDLAGQAVSQFSASDHTIQVAAGMETPRFKCLVLGWGGATTSDVAIGEHPDNFGVGRRALDAAVFVATTEYVSLESRGTVTFHNSLGKMNV